MTWLQEPSLDEARRFLGQELGKLSLSSRAILVIGRCRIDYEGRAASTLDEGDRIVLVKPDGTLLVHNPTGLKPVNWQPPGGTVRVDGSTGLVIVSSRPKPPETLRLTFTRVALVGDERVLDGAPIAVRGTEFDLRDALRSRPDLVEPGFRPWERERMTERGPMDLYGEDAQGRRVIVEVKRTRAGLAEVTQLWRYVEKERTKRGVVVRGILAAPAISDRARLLLSEHGLEFLELQVDALKARIPPRGGARSLLDFDSKP